MDICKDLGEFFLSFVLLLLCRWSTRARCCLAARHLKVRGLPKWLKVPNCHAARGDAYSCRESIRKALNICGEVYIVTCFSQFFNRTLEISQSEASLLCLIVSLIYKSLYVLHWNCHFWPQVVYLMKGQCRFMFEKKTWVTKWQMLSLIFNSVHFSWNCIFFLLPINILLYSD